MINEKVINQKILEHPAKKEVLKKRFMNGLSLFLWQETFVIKELYITLKNFLCLYFKIKELGTMELKTSLRENPRYGAFFFEYTKNASSFEICKCVIRKL